MTDSIAGPLSVSTSFTIVVITRPGVRSGSGNQPEPESSVSASVAISAFFRCSMRSAARWSLPSATACRMRALVTRPRKLAAVGVQLATMSRSTAWASRSACANALTWRTLDWLSNSWSNGMSREDDRVIFWTDLATVVLRDGLVGSLSLDLKPVTKLRPTSSSREAASRRADDAEKRRTSDTESR